MAGKSRIRRTAHKELKIKNLQEVQKNFDKKYNIRMATKKLSNKSFKLIQLNQYVS